MNQHDKPIVFALCDDNADDRAALRHLCAAYLDESDLVATIEEFSSGEALLAADPARFALIFLDIYMDGINGMQTAEAIVEKGISSRFVFCSTSGEFAAQSYDVDAMHYLIKPAEKQKIFRLLDRFFQEYNASRTVTVKIGRRTETLLMSEILYVEADNKKTKFITKHGVLETSESFAAVCRKLTPPDFVRPIRYALVSMREVAAVPTDVVLLSNGDTVPVSRGERANMKDAFAAYKWSTLSMRR